MFLVLFCLFITFEGRAGQVLTATKLSTALPQDLHGTSAIYDGDDSIYIFGGRGDGFFEESDSIYHFSIADETIKLITNMPEKGSRGSVEYSQDEKSIFYFGGYDWTYNAVFRFYPDTLECAKVAEFNNSVQQGPSVTFGDKVVIFGALGSQDLLSFDMLTLKVEKVGAFPPTPLRYAYEHTAVKVRDKTVYVFNDGSSQGEELVTVFDMETFDSQIVSTSLPNMKFEHPTSVFDGTKYVYLIGGYNMETSGMNTGGIVRIDIETFAHDIISVEGFPVGWKFFFEDAPSAVFVKKLNRIYLFGGLVRDNGDYSYKKILNEISYIDLTPLSDDDGGKHVHYVFNVGYKCGAPDGVDVCHILAINDQFPGPTIEANIGDTLHITVNNLIANQEDLTDTSIHWHGLFQKGTQFQDGPDMVTQCPIPKSNRQTYVFPVKQSGTYWYHGHVKWQYTEGLWGPLIIHNTPEVYAADYDHELTIVVSDWYHTAGAVNSAWFLSPESQGYEPIPSSGLINGHGSYPCGATQRTCDPSLQTPPTFKVQKGKRYRIRVINTSAISKFYFSIQGHQMEVIEVDGVDTVKVALDRFPIAAGQRYSVIVNMDVDVGGEFLIWALNDVSMFRRDIPNVNPNPDALIPLVTAKLIYVDDVGLPVGGPDRLLPQQPPPIHESERLFISQQLLAPYDGVLAPESYDTQIVLNVDELIDTGIHHLSFNNVPYKASTTIPLLAIVKENLRIPTNVNPYHVSHNQVVEIVINTHATGAHPFHLHGHTFFVMGYGLTNVGKYNRTTDASGLIRNGVRRDVIDVMGGSWAVIRFIANNPGVWFFHCHIDWHLQSGLAATIIEGEEILQNELTIPWEARRICAANNIPLPNPVG